MRTFLKVASPSFIFTLLPPGTDTVAATPLESPNSALGAKLTYRDNTYQCSANICNKAILVTF